MARKTKNNGEMAMAPVFDVAPITTGMDQPLVLAGASLDSALTQVENIINYAVDSQSPDVALDLLLSLAKFSQIATIAKAKAFWLLSRRWAELGMMDAFEDEITRRIGYSPDTTGRYIKAWDELVRIQGVVDSEMWNRFAGRPIEDLVAIAQARNRHGDWTKTQLEKLARCENNSVLRQTIQKIVHGQENKGEDTVVRGLVIRLKRNGELTVMNGRKSRVFGKLLTEPEFKEDELIVRGINFLVDEAGILVE